MSQRIMFLFLNIMKKVKKENQKQLYHNLIKPHSHMSEFAGEIINNNTVYTPT